MSEGAFFQDLAVLMAVAGVVAGFFGRFLCLFAILLLLFGSPKAAVI